MAAALSPTPSGSLRSWDVSETLGARGAQDASSCPYASWRRESTSAGEGALGGAPALAVRGAQPFELRLVRRRLDLRRRHNQRVFVVVGVVALAHAHTAEAVLLVQRLRTRVADAALQRQHALAALLRQRNRGEQQQLADPLPA